MIKKLATFSFMLLIFLGRAYSMEFEVTASGLSSNRTMMMTISGEGEITKGDANRLQDALDKGGYKPDLWHTHIILSLNSRGGDLIEALSLFDLLQKKYISTYIPEYSECYSACAIVFMAGRILIDPEYSTPYRTVHPRGKLGIHAPDLRIEDFGSIPRNVINLAYSEALLEISELLSRIQQADIHRTFIEKMITTPPQEMYIIETIDDLMRWNISIDTKPERNWEPSKNEISRVCMNGKNWEIGLESDYRWHSKSISSFGYEISPEETVNTENYLSKEIKLTKIIDISGVKIDAFYVEIETLDGTQCVAAINDYGDGKSVAVHYVPSVETAIELIKSGNLGKRFYSQAETNASDLKISDLPNNSDIVEDLKVQIQKALKKFPRCRIIRNQTEISNEYCDEYIEGDIYRFKWPSNEITVIEKTKNGILINGNTASDVAARNGELCLKNTGSGNVFCVQKY